MSAFYQNMRDFVLQHGATNNSYLGWFRTGALSDKELYDFALEFYNFARFFPKILAAQLVNTEDEIIAAQLTEVLYSELGGGQSQHRHELLYRNFLRTIGIDIHGAIAKPMMPSTKAYIDGMEELYSSVNNEQALGASFGLENMAITMWDHLIPGLTTLKNARLPHMDLSYFTFHRELEAGHEEAMKTAVVALEEHASEEGDLSHQERLNFHDGVTKVLNFLEGFWMGLEHMRMTDIHSRQKPLSGGIECTIRTMA